MNRPMALQELDFTIDYINGDKNHTADALSRLCLNRKEENKYIMAALHVDRVLTTEHYKSISSCHNSMMGHGGLERTVRELKQLKLNKESMRADVHVNLYVNVHAVRKCLTLNHQSMPINTQHQHTDLCNV